MRKSLLSLAVLALVVSPAFAGKYNKALSIGDKAPSFDGIPAVTGTEDTSLTLSDIKDDVVVVAFLANHCPAVLATEDRVIDLATKFKGKGVKFVGLSVTTAAGHKDQDDIAGIKSRYKEKPYNFVYGYDESQKLGKAYGAMATPTFFVLDKERKIRYIGAIDDNVQNESKVEKTYLKDAIESVLAGKEVAVTETRAPGCGISYGK
jgi:thiol-disulfide isomerase/thioredoxin